MTSTSPWIPVHVGEPSLIVEPALWVREPGAPARGFIKTNAGCSSRTVLRVADRTLSVAAPSVPKPVAGNE